MNSVGISLIVFACVAGGALFGMFLGSVLPPKHLTSEAKDTVKVGMGLIGTMTAILLGLLIASAKTFYDTQSTELTKLSSNVILLDRILAHCGPDAKDARYAAHRGQSRTCYDVAGGTLGQLPSGRSTGWRRGSVRKDSSVNTAERQSTRPAEPGASVWPLTSEKPVG